MPRAQQAPKRAKTWAIVIDMPLARPLSEPLSLPYLRTEPIQCQKLN